jgi:transposase
MDWTGLKLLLEGIEPLRVRKRYKIAHSHRENASINAVRTA